MHESRLECLMLHWLCNQEDNEVTELLGFSYSYVGLRMHNIEFSWISCMANIKLFKMVDVIFTFFKSADVLHEFYSKILHSYIG